MIQTEFPFTLPYGLVDAQGTILREGLIRRATVLDEVEPLQDERVQANEALLGLLILSRVVLRLGPVAPVTPQLLGQLFTADYAFLQDLYEQLNGLGSSVVETACPSCGVRFSLDIAQGGG
ncbi:phage tail assembly protein [Oscillochloris sp. ZM17-4]|uniref:phage tail assembly protein n=1 Tax=Oscillochloris sp. ZM17-4 TaxID=2866714 RepID=UPI001C73366F|nr:phage tail assembly protein [Oscillochloris sp. ZM17-4]MBX0331207.1 phage tail assembly protein [Oscillochloris sp. ZM17-4]